MIGECYKHLVIAHVDDLLLAVVANAKAAKTSQATGGAFHYLFSWYLTGTFSSPFP